MGAAASMEDESNNSGGPSRATSARPASKHLPQSALSSRPGSTHSGESKLPTPPAGQSRPGSRASSRQSWKSAFQTTGYQSANARKIRAAALGRKSAYTVTIDKNGFSVQKLHLCEGQVVTFVWNDAEGSGFNITQVVHDGDQYRPVVGGYNSGPVTVKGFFEQQFNIEGEYKFVSAGIRCTPLAVSVDPRMPIEAEITDKGFFPKIIRLDEGNSVNWTWEDCAVPHSIYEVRYCPQTGGLVRPESQNQMVATKTGNHLYEFLKPGLTYFQTEGNHAGILHSCVIHVRERQREFKVHVYDRSFDPPIMVVEEGDRIWWQWDRENCKKPHCIYQIEPPPLNHPHDESYKPVKNGFKWPAPSKNGLMSYEFNDPGIFYYSDHNFNEAAEYIGTIIVKPKQKEHFVELSPDGFSPDLIYAETGDRVWWTWNINDMDPSFTINEVDRCVSPLGARPGLDVMPQGEKSYMDEETMEVMVQVGLSTIQLGHIGVYHYRVADSPHSITTSSIIVNPGPRNHTVHVTDSGFNPKVLTIHPRDRVWFVWQQGSKQHNIVQVSHQGSNIKGGFCSGCPMDAPSAYLHQFKDPGVYYYISSNLPKSFGAIVVSSQPQVHEVQVTATGLVPDPVPININDVVAWTFRGLRHNDVMQVDSVDQILDAQFNSPTIQPRRCLNRLFQVKGVVHFASKSFMKQSKKDNRAGDENRVSSVIVDDSSDSALVRVDSTGFHPSTVTIDKGHSVLWTWKESGDESHNIVHVNPPDSDVPLSVIQGSKSFNSGRPVANNSFLYTFDEPGIHCVASQGAPGYAGTIHVLNQGERTEMPYIISEVNGGSVEKHTVVKMATESKDAKIYYTIDGNAPEMHKMAPKIYKKDKGIILKNSGLCFVRAMAVSPGKLNSEVFTSKRFWVLSGDDRGATSSDDGEMIDDGNKHLKMQEWRNAVPIIKGCLTEPGVMEIFWEPPPSEALKHVRGYQVFLNGVSYCDLFPPSHNSVNIAGLAGGRLYEVHLEVYPHDAMYLPHKSNQLVMKVPLTTSTGGPVVSLEVTQQQDALAIVWMSIATHENPMQGYRVYLNGQLCGNMVVPDEKSDRCKVVIEGCQLNLVYRVVVMAIPEGNGKPKMSNELEVSLPLETENIVLPPHDARVDDDDVYKEYVEIREGTGYLPQMDQDKKKKKKKHKNLVVEVEETAADLSMQDTRQMAEHQGAAPGSAVVVSSAVPVLGSHDGQEHLPAPIVTAQNAGDDTVLVTWDLPRNPEPLYRLLVFSVNVIGLRFKKQINSDISFECLQDSGTETISAIQQVWNVTKGMQCEVRGLMPGMKYKIFVVATYTLVNRQQPCEIQASSAPIIYTTMGPPPAPTLRPVSADLYRVMLGWDPLDTHADVRVSGYRVIVDGKQLGEDLTSNYIQTSIDNLTPGKTIKVQVEALTSHPVGDSEPSNAIRVTCPQRPPAPNIVQQPSYKKGSVIVAWEKPSTYGTSAEDIIFYRIFLDGKLHGEVKSNSTCNKNGYQYYLTDLDPGQSYDVSVRVYAGQRKVDPTAEHVYCLSESVDSNSVPVMCPAPPTSPCLRLDGMHAEGIDVTWEMPQQYGDAAVSGYQMLREGRLYGSIIPPDVHSLRIKDIQLGDILKLQILALTDHPVGRHEKKSDSPVEGVDSGIDGSHPDDRGFSEIFIGDRYSACKPGPKLVVHYTGLVQPPAKVWVEHVTGHSAMIVWSITDKPKAHFVQPESYQVTWWPGDKADNDINSQSTNTPQSKNTKSDHLTITGLKSNTVYSVVVEARKMQRYTDMEENTDGVPEDAYQSSFILTGQSEHVTLRTAGHPDAPTNLGVVTTTCHSIQVSWDPPQDRGVDIIALRVDAIAMQAGNETRRHAMVEVVPDCTTTVVNNLSEKTEYLISVTAITEEFFDQLPEENLVKKSRQLPKNKPPEESPWLPSSSVLISTSGTDPPADVTIADTKVNAVKIQWKPAVVHGSNRLQGHVVRWVEARHTRHGIPADETELTHHRTLVAEDNEMVIEDLAPGILYKIVVEAVVSVKTTIELGHRDPQVEKRNRRTTHVLSVPVYVRTRAPCEPPYPIITAYTPTTIQLYWEKPLLWSIIGKDDNDNPKYLKLSLEGYRLEINGKPHMRLAPNAQSCTLIKCKPGRTYQIVLIAMTCTESVKKDRKKKMRGTIHGNTTLSSSLSSLGTSKTWEPLSEDDENDETASKPLVVSLPRENDGYIKDLSAYYEFSKSGQEQDLGDIHIDWTVHSTGANIGQYNIISHCLGDGIIQTKCADADIRNSVLPVKMRKCLYNIQLEPKYNTDVVPSEPQMVQALIPGSPEAPEIWTRSVGRDEFVIEWGEPRLYVVKIRGYQVYLNGKKVGNMLSSSHRKAVIPCKPRKGYKVSLVALSADPNYPDSEQSNVLLINSGGSGDTVTFEDDPPYRLHDDGSDLPVTVVEVTDTTIHMEWKTYLASDEVAFYKVQWSSVAQPSEREVQLNATERSCILHNCFPGTNHFIRVMSVNVHSQVLDRSRQLTIQTSASPDPPVVTVRACNFRYIAIQWEKPSQYGDAKVTGYKVYVNGVVEAILGSEQFTYSFTQGKWCREYAFQVQALATVDKLNSRPSDPLIVMWPGVQPPILRRAPAVSGNSLKVLWDTPNTTEGVKIKQYKVIAREQESDRVVQVISPIHPDTTEAELHNLKQGTYLVHVEVLVHGSDEAVRSEAIRICPTLNPDPPYITVTVVGLEERRQIEKVSCDLINRRDRLLSIINRGASSPRHTSDEKVHMATENLAQVEAMLDDCLAALKHYTGHLLAHVSWTCPQSNPDMHVTGYKVLVDGKQYGTTLHAGIKNVRIKLGLNKPSHRLSMVSVCDRPHNVSLESNVVELLTEPFHPFNFFNFLDSSRKDFSISYEEALKQEKKQSSKKLLNSGVQKRHVPPPSCTVLDLFEAEYHPLFPPSGPRRPTILLFWASWSLASMRALTWFVRFARDYKADYDFISIACTDGDATAAEKQGLVRVVSENGWRDDSCIRHCTSHSVASYTISNDTKEYLNKTATKEGAVDITELFGVTGVPTIIIVHPEDYIAWKGRYCAFDFASFENFMRYSLSEVMDEHPTAYNPWDTDVDVKVLDVAKKKQMNESQMLIHRGGSMHTGTNSTIIHAPTYPTMNGHARPHSAKRLFTKTHKNKNKDKISVNIRPYSANSPYEQRFMATLPVKQSRKSRSGRKLHKYTM